MKDRASQINFKVGSRSIEKMGLTQFFKDNLMSTQEQITFARDFWYPKHLEEILALSPDQITAKYENPEIAKLFILLTTEQTASSSEI